MTGVFLTQFYCVESAVKVEKVLKMRKEKLSFSAKKDRHEIDNKSERVSYVSFAAKFFALFTY